MYNMTASHPLTSKADLEVNLKHKRNAYLRTNELRPQGMQVTNPAKAVARTLKHYENSKTRCHYMLFSLQTCTVQHYTVKNTRLVALILERPELLTLALILHRSKPLKM